MKNTLLFFIIIFLNISCVKDYQPFLNDTTIEGAGFTAYNIPAGSHYSLQSAVKEVADSSMVFEVLFDSSAIYKTAESLNQYDVNKLYGFIEGLDPHKNSARIGWGFSESELRLYAYAYKDGIRTIAEITTVKIGSIIRCAILASANFYLFTVNENYVKLERASFVAPIKCYQLYPYFGGDETAPHAITIKIKTR